MRSKGSIIAILFFGALSINCFSMGSIGAGIIASIITVMVWFFTTPSEDAKNKHKKDQQDRLDKVTRAQMQQAYVQKRKQYIQQLDFNSDVKIQKILSDVLKTDYIDIVLMCDHISASNQKYMFFKYGINQMALDELEKLAKYIKPIVQKKDTYTIKPIVQLIEVQGGAVGGYFGPSHTGSVQWYRDDNLPSDKYKTLGYRLCNDNFDANTGIYKVWDNSLKRYRRWDINKRIWLD